MRIYVVVRNYYPSTNHGDYKTELVRAFTDETQALRWAAFNNAERGWLEVQETTLEGSENASL